MIDATEVYNTIKHSITCVVEEKFQESLKLHTIPSITPIELVLLVDEMARNSAQAVILLYESKG